ncbi:MAG: ImmA/IrrE family metallo-endopeptidase [Bacillota bacterium]
MRNLIVKSVKNLITQFGTRDPIQIAEQLGMTVIPYPFGRIKGLIMEIHGHKFIGVNSRLPRIIQKALIAHELGHGLLSPAGVSYFFLVEKTLFRADKQERTANQFAAELLIGEEPAEYGETLEEFAKRLGIPLELVKVRYLR